ncbi:MAG: hypothetical protein M3P04_12600 [Actinomycetota bacterium]|nr:hypothetical protein [Actinomycetota bacterium]
MTAHHNCELVEESDLPEYRLEGGSPLANEPDLRVPFFVYVIFATVRVEPKRRVKEADPYGLPADPKSDLALAAFAFKRDGPRQAL